MGFFDFMTQEIAIDLGTANTLIINNDKVVVDEPSIVAKDIILNKVVAIGKKAQQMHGKTHRTIETIRPLKDGVIADFQAAEQMIRGMIKMIPSRKHCFNLHSKWLFVFLLESQKLKNELLRIRPNTLEQKKFI